MVPSAYPAARSPSLTSRSAVFSSIQQWYRFQVLNPMGGSNGNSGATSGPRAAALALAARSGGKPGGGLLF